MTRSGWQGIALIVVAGCAGKVAPSGDDTAVVDTDQMAVDTDLADTDAVDTDPVDTDPPCLDTGTLGSDCEGLGDTWVPDETDSGWARLVFGDLVITEVMVAPSPDACATAAQGQYLEIKNATDHTVDLQDLVIRYGVGTYTIPTSLSVPSGGYVVGRPDLASCAGYPVSFVADFTYPASMVFSADGATTTVSLQTRTFVTIDAMNFGTWQLGQCSDRFTTGVAAQVIAGREDATSNDDPASWCNADEALGVVAPVPNLGSPGRQATGCGPAPVVDSADTAGFGVCGP